MYSHFVKFHVNLSAIVNTCNRVLDSLSCLFPKYLPLKFTIALTSEFGLTFLTSAYPGPNSEVSVPSK